MTDLELIRLTIGLSRPTYLAVLGAAPTRYGMLTSANRTPDPFLISRSHELLWHFGTWRNTIVDPAAYPCTLQEFAQRLGITMEKLYYIRSKRLMRNDGDDACTPNYRVTSTHAVQLFRSIQAAMTDRRIQRSPLAPVFLRWLYMYHPDFEPRHAV